MSIWLVLVLAVYNLTPMLSTFRGDQSSQLTALAQVPILLLGGPFNWVLTCLLTCLSCYPLASALWRRGEEKEPQRWVALDVLDALPLTSRQPQRQNIQFGMAIRVGLACSAVLAGPMVGYDRIVGPFLLGQLHRHLSAEVLVSVGAVGIPMLMQSCAALLAAGGAERFRSLHAIMAACVVTPLGAIAGWAIFGWGPSVQLMLLTVTDVAALSAVLFGAGVMALARVKFSVIWPGNRR